MHLQMCSLDDSKSRQVYSEDSPSQGVLLDLHGHLTPARRLCICNEHCWLPTMPLGLYENSFINHPLPNRGCEEF